MTATAETTKGNIVKIVGPVVDVQFPPQAENFPKIYDALTVTGDAGQQIVLEVQQQIGEDTVRCIAMDITDGLYRGMEVSATGAPIKMPVGKQIRGRLFNVSGQAIDGLEDLPGKTVCPSTARRRSSTICPPPPKYCSPASR